MAKGGGKSGKVRYDGLDVAAMVNQLQRDLLGRRIINIYDGVSDSDAFLFKFDGGRTMLFLESGIRFHATKHQSSLQQEGMPSPYCSKLRKHLRGLRLERVVQLGKYDRVVNFVFGTGESRHSLILELYARGNLILTDSSYQILALLRSHEYEEVSVKVGQIYPVTYATSLGNTFEGILNKDAEGALAWARDELEQHEAKKKESSKKNASSVMPLKAFLLKPTSGVYHYGPSLLEHCILCAGLDPNAKIGIDTIDVALSTDEWATLIDTLREEGTKIMDNLAVNDGNGFILYQPKGSKGDQPKNNPSSLLVGGLDHVDKVLLEFQPHILKQHEARPMLKYDSFSDAVDDFFAHLGGQKQALRAETAEASARQKLEKIRKDQEQRVYALLKEQDRLKDHAEIIQAHAEDVDKALSVINSALDTGMDWEALEQLVGVEKKNENPIALLIKKLELEEDAMVMSLPDIVSEEEKNGKISRVNVTVSLQESAFGNARNMFSKYRAFKEKAQKTLEASKSALKAAEANAQRVLLDAQKKSKLNTTIQAARKPHWFEKFHWFITSDNYLVLGGRDAHQNEMLVKRYLRPGDAYLHADVHGASSCIVRAKRRRTKSGNTEPVPLSEQALREAGSFTICRSSAWTSKIVTSAWWVESHQVSKTAPTGEYLKVGSFMVRGKKNFLPPSQLEMGLAVLFRLGDDDSITRHRNERRDFALMDSFDEAVESDHESTGPSTMSEDISVGIPARVEVDKEELSDMNDKPGGQIFVRKDVVLDDQKEKEGVGLVVEDDSGRNHLHGDKLEPALLKEIPKKKGFSMKERKQIKKYGSLEAAEKAAAEREKADLEARAKLAIMTRPPCVHPEESSQDQGKLRRGKRGKMKKAARRYADQDEEDKELALMALHGGEKKVRNRSGKAALSATSEYQEKAGAEAYALLVTDSAVVANSLPGEVKDLLAECVTVASGVEEEHVVRWDKFDGDVLAQLQSLDSIEKQVSAAKRLLQLKQFTRVDNFSASLAGIIRTIQKFGDVSLETEIVEGGKRKTKEEKQREKENWKETLAAEGLADELGDEDGIDDSVEIGKLTGIPASEDSLLYAVPVCAPYQTLSKYKYRIKLNPGNLKRGKAAKQCVDIFLKGDGDKSLHSERNRELIKRIVDNDWVQVICSDVKISTPGAVRNNKQKKANVKKGKMN